VHVSLHSYTLHYRTGTTMLAFLIHVCHGVAFCPSLFDTITYLLTLHTSVFFVSCTKSPSANMTRHNADIFGTHEHVLC
jgi:hypothetical protein